ncbi:MAG: thiamine phosphate synthase [Coriobacteriales bacterium]|jgi:thiamine-phosphate pyrophosphorylase
MPAVMEPDYRLYLVTDRELMSTETLEEAVESACRGGATLVQLREKHDTHEQIVERARAIKEITDRYGVGLIVNDDPVAAVEVGALGVHVGQSDLEAGAVRKIVGQEMIVGVSASNVEQAIRADLAGADYLGVGAMAFTATKPEADTCTMEELARIRDEVDIPIVVIGGINMKSIPRFEGMGIDGYAIVSAIMAADDIEQAARDIRDLIDSEPSGKLHPRH